MKSTRGLGAWARTCLALENGVKEPSPWPLGVQVFWELGSSWERRWSRKVSDVSGKCAQAAKAFTKESALLFPFLATAAWCWLHFQFSRHWRRPSLNKSVHILAFGRTLRNLEVNVPVPISVRSLSVSSIPGVPCPFKSRGALVQSSQLGLARVSPCASSCWCFAIRILSGQITKLFGTLALHAFSSWRWLALVSLIWPVMVDLGLGYSLLSFPPTPALQLTFLLPVPCRYLSSLHLGSNASILGEMLSKGVGVHVKESVSQQRELCFPFLILPPPCGTRWYPCFPAHGSARGQAGGHQYVLVSPASSSWLSVLWDFFDWWVLTRYWLLSRLDTSLRGGITNIIVMNSIFHIFSVFAEFVSPCLT